MKILVTGGAGYIGSHTVVELLNSRHQVVIVDNFSNSSPGVLSRLRQLTGWQPTLYKGTVQDRRLLHRIFSEHRIDAVMHFAGLKAVGASMQQPLEYYRTNIESSLALCEVMRANNVKKLIFSSSATVYGDPQELPLRETSTAGYDLANPYGRSKYMVEQILHDLAAAETGWQITLLRYFNPIGAHDSGLIGEDPRGIPNNLLPYISRVAAGVLERLQVFGKDYDTVDGTGVRDYIHVVDVAQGHVAALEQLRPADRPEVYNLGRGRGTSVLEVVRTFEAVSGKTIPYHVTGARAGDVASLYADVSKARVKLGWQASKSLEEACVDAWRWQSQHPDGFSGVRRPLVAVAG